MKRTILLIVLALFVGKSYAQRLDSTDIMLRTVCMHLDKSHKQFSAGTIFFFTGVAIAGFTGFIEGQSKGNEYTDPRTGLKMYEPVNHKPFRAIYIVSSALSFAGAIIMIDSHRHIGKAGRVFE